MSYSEKRKKIGELNTDLALKMIYQWIKQSAINMAQYLELTNAIIDRIVTEEQRN